MNVSVVVITKNEAATIRSMLESVGWAQETVVVDCGSTDGTQEIAGECGARVLHHDFEDFASQKNFAHDAASLPWILNLDADEFCTPELAREIAALPDSQADGYLISRRNYFQGRWIRHCGWHPDYKLRLYRRSAGSWQGKVHESVCLQPGSRTAKLSSGIEHHTYKDFDRYLGSIRQFARLAALQMQEQGKSASMADLVFRPPAVFFKKYLLQLGFLDRRPGFVISALSAYAIFCRYNYLSEMPSSGDVREIART